MSMKMLMFLTFVCLQYNRGQERGISAFPGRFIRDAHTQILILPILPWLRMQEDILSLPTTIEPIIR